MHAASRPDIWLVYDGECPVCRSYVQHVRLKQAAGQLHLVDARKPSALREEIRAAGLQLDEGIVLKIGPQLYHGADAAHRLSLMTTTSGVFNRFNARLFASPRIARLAYPVLRAGRNALLRLLGIGRIDANRRGDR